MSTIDMLKEYLRLYDEHQRSLQEQRKVIAYVAKCHRDMQESWARLYSLKPKPGAYRLVDRVVVIDSTDCPTPLPLEGNVQLW